MEVPPKMAARAAIEGLREERGERAGMGRVVELD
jgi:hypothetical protein